MEKGTRLKQHNPTVRELIEILQQVDPDAVVCIRDPRYDDVQCETILSYGIEETEYFDNDLQSQTRTVFWLSDMECK